MLSLIYKKKRRRELPASLQTRCADCNEVRTQCLNALGLSPFRAHVAQCDNCTRKRRGL